MNTNFNDKKEDVNIYISIYRHLYLLNITTSLLVTAITHHYRNIINIYMFFKQFYECEINVRLFANKNKNCLLNHRLVMIFSLLTGYEFQFFIFFLWNIFIFDKKLHLKHFLILLPFSLHICLTLHFPLSTPVSLNTRLTLHLDTHYQSLSVSTFFMSAFFLYLSVTVSLFVCLSFLLALCVTFSFSVSLSQLPTINLVQIPNVVKAKSSLRRYNFRIFVLLPPLSHFWFLKGVKKSQFMFFVLNHCFQWIYWQSARLFYHFTIVIN